MLFLEGGDAKLDASMGMGNYSGHRNIRVGGTSSSSSSNNETRNADDIDCSTVLPRPRKLATLGSYKGGLGAGDDEALTLPPASFRKGPSNDRPVARDRARAVAAVPYPTMRSLRKT